MFGSIIGTVMTLEQFMICSASSVALGLLTALMFARLGKRSSSFALALALMPLTVQVVIMLVNGNIGAGLAVAGAFSLVRFRSAPGTAREIVAVFIAMAEGLATGMGCLVAGFAFFVISALLVLILTKLNFGGEKISMRELKITIPENLDYDGLFDDIFKKYGMKAELVRVKTTNMGTLYDLTYDVEVPNATPAKEMLDEIRCKNGNLTVVFGRRDTESQSL